MTRVARSRWARGIGRAALGSVLFAGGLATMVAAQVATSQPATASTPQSVLLSLGTEHACAVTATATVDCWGTNRYGQLGDGTDTSSASPVPVVGVGGTGTLSGVVSIVAGGDHTCALTNAGHVDCWGTNQTGPGQLGDGSTTSSTVPVIVEGVGGAGELSTVTSIAAGAYQTCALTTGGDVDCWGDGSNGQLGNASNTSSTVPVTVKGVGGTGLLSTVTSIAAGGYFTCALTTARTVDCFGTGYNGELGNNTRTGSNVPRIVDGTGGTGTTLSTVTSIAAEGYGACAVTAAGNVDCWGYGEDGELGNGSYTNSTIPVRVEAIGGTGTLSSVRAVSGGWYSTCALLSSGHVDCWGTNTTGQLGDNSSTPTDVPVEVETGPGALSDATAIAAGGYDACVVQSTGHVDCWGSDYVGQLGQGFFTNSNVPVAVEGVGGTGTLSGATAVSAGKVQACALVTGEVRCWGKGAQGELGDGSRTSSTVPVTVEGVGGTGTLSGVTAVSAGGLYYTGEVGYTCALLSTGRVDCWGTNATGELGDGSTTYSTVPVSVKGVGGTGTLSTIAALSAGGGQTCALTTGGDVDCWGQNRDGQLGDGSTTSSTVPVKVEGVGGTGLLSTVTSVSAGQYHTCAVASGDAVCWGTGDYLGDGSYASSDSPVDVEGVGGTGTLSTVAAVAAGAYQTCALTSTGHVDCWGEGDDGTLGNGTHTSTLAPVKVKGVGGTGTLSAVAAITSGTALSCTLTTAGAVDCWGYNGEGELGSGSFVETSDVPVAVAGPGGTGLLSAISEVSAGASFACALTTAGAVDCWGTNYYGQLGDGLISKSVTPVQVPGLLLPTSPLTFTTTTPTTTTTTTPTTTTTTAATSTCPFGAKSCSSKSSVGTRGATVTTTGAKATGSGGHGTLAIGTYKHDPVGKLPGDAGAFFGLAESTGATFKTVTFEDCSMGTGTTLDWWNGRAWVPVVSGSVSHSTVGGATCLSVTLGSTSKPSLATLERMTRSSRLGAILITSVS